MSAISGFDPFRAADPPVLVHDVGLPEFERAWAQDSGENSGAGNDDDGGGTVRCPICGEGTVDERGVAPASQRAWVRFSCGDFVTQESTAG
jgi:hypothetical protein